MIQVENIAGMITAEIVRPLQTISEMTALLLDYFMEKYIHHAGKIYISQSNVDFGWGFTAIKGGTEDGTAESLGCIEAHREFPEPIIPDKFFHEVSFKA